MRTAAFPASRSRRSANADFSGLTVPAALRRPRSGPADDRRGARRHWRSTAPSTAMVYLMHLCGVACYATRGRTRAGASRAAAGLGICPRWRSARPGSRSHFWAPVSQAAPRTGGHVPSSAQQVVRHIGRTCRRLRRFHARSRRRRDADREHDLLSCSTDDAGRDSRRRLGRARDARQRQRADDARQCEPRTGAR